MLVAAILFTNQTDVSFADDKPEHDKQRLLKNVSSELIYKMRDCQKKYTVCAKEKKTRKK